MSSNISASSASTPEALLVAPAEPGNSEFRSRTIVITRPEDVYQRWVYFRSEDRSGVGYVEDVLLAPLLHEETNSNRFVLWVKPSRGVTRKMRASVGTEIELASPHHVHQWIAEHEAAVLRDKRAGYAGVPVVVVLIGIVLGAVTDNILGSGLSLTLTIGGLAAITAVALASNQDSRMRSVTRSSIRELFGTHGITHIAVLNKLAALDEEARLAAEAAEAEAAAAAEAADEDTENPTTEPDNDEETPNA